MSRILLALSCLLIVISELNSQVTFSKTYNLEEDVWVRGREIDFYNEHLYILTGKICSNPERECGDIVKMDLDGNIIWKKEIGAFDIGNTNAVWIYNDTITITGHRNNPDQPLAYFVQKISIEGDSLIYYEYPVDTNLVLSALNYGSLLYQEELFLFGAGFALDGSVDAILIKTNNNGDIINCKVWDKGFRELQLYDLKMLDNGKFVYMVEGRPFGNEDRERYLVDLDDNTLSGENINQLPVFGVFNQLIRFQYSSGYYTCLSGDMFLPSSIPTFYILNEDGQQENFYEFEHQFGINFQRVVANLTTTANGDIIGVGFHRFVNQKDSGWLFRMSPQGDLLWETTFKSQNWKSNEQSATKLNDVFELEDGSLVAVGWYEESTDPLSPRDLWVIRVGPDGCLYEEDCGFNQFTTSTIDEDFDTIETWVFPNPASNILYIDSVNEFDNFKIIQLDGRLVMDGEFQPSIDVSQLEPGMYVIQFVKKGTAESVKKFIKY